jgi:hypothetical protein
MTFGPGKPLLGSPLTEDHMKSSTLNGKNPLETFGSWRLSSGPALWPTVLRILFVIDGRINTGKDPPGFGFG